MTSKERFLAAMRNDVPDRVPVRIKGAEADEVLTALPERDAMLRRTTRHTPHGDLTEEEICFRGEPPTHTERLIKDLESDWPKMGWLLGQEASVDVEGSVEGNVGTLTYAWMDTPQILDEWAELGLARGTRIVREYLDTKPDYLCLGGSGTLTLASPELARRYALPAIREWSAMAREAGAARRAPSRSPPQ